MNIAFVVISMPHLAHRLEALRSDFKQRGFPEPGVVWGLPAAGRSTEQRNSAIFTTHEAVVRGFLQQSKADVLAVFEDDARWVGDTSLAKLHSIIEELREHDWVSCHLGQTPLGPILPCASLLLCRSLRPYGAHAYLLNGAVLRRTGLPTHVPCARPHFFEGMTAVHWQQRFATLQPICIQIEPPAEMPKWAARALSYEGWAVLFTILWCLIPLVALSFSAVMVTLLTICALRLAVSKAPPLPAPEVTVIP